MEEIHFLATRNGGMTGQDLFHQGGAGARQADDEYRPVAVASRWRKAREVLPGEVTDHVVRELLLGRRFEGRSHLRGAFPIGRECPVVVAAVVPGLAQRVEERSLGVGRHAPHLRHQCFHARQVGIAWREPVNQRKGQPVRTPLRFERDRPPRQLRGLREVTQLARDRRAQVQHRGMLLDRRRQQIGLTQARIEATARRQCAAVMQCAIQHARLGQSEAPCRFEPEVDLADLVGDRLDVAPNDPRRADLPSVPRR